MLSFSKREKGVGGVEKKDLQILKTAMKEAHFRFYATLNYFLPSARRQITFLHRLKEDGSIKDTIEALGVPHPEVDLMLVNGESVDFSYLVQDGDWISVYPPFTTLDLTPLGCLRSPLQEIRFVVDTHLGKLATYLRLLGFDTLYRNDYQDRELAEISSQEGRILLTRDRGLLKRSIVTYGYCVRQDWAEKQLVEILQRFDLYSQIRPFQRCLRCNGLIQSVAKDKIDYRLLPKTRKYYDEFHICEDCQQIYWQGSHYQQMHYFVEKVLAHLNMSALPDLW